MRTNDARAKCVSPGRAPWIRLAAILVALHHGPIRAETNPPAAPIDLPPFTITHLAYATNGMLTIAPNSMRPNVTSFFYGEPVTNLVFRAELPSAKGARSLRAQGNAAPARPDRPSFRIDRWDRPAPPLRADTTIPPAH